MRPVRFPEARRPGHRKKAPGNLPNFRDHGRTVHRRLMRVVENAARKHRVAFASEAAYRLMIAQDCGHYPGIDVVRHTLREWHRRRKIVQFHTPGGHDTLPDGAPLDFGTRLIFVPGSRAYDRALLLARRLEAEDQPLRMSARWLRWTMQEARAELDRQVARELVAGDRAEAEARAKAKIDAQAAAFAARFPYPGRPPD